MSQVPEIETGNLAVSRWVLCPPNSLKIVNWNINRGLQLQKVIQFLAGAKPDIVLLQECDLNARRTHHLNIAREIAQQLQLNYVFGREFQELTQGSRRSPAYHGQSTLSRWPLSNSRILRFRKQSNFWRPHWFIPEIDPFQERIGGRLALVSEVDLGGKIIVTYNLHLESRGNDGLRESQIEEALHDAGQYSANTPVLIAGDFNMNVSTGISAVAIREAQFQDAFVNQHPATTPGSFFEDGRVIDWIFLRGPVRSRQPQVYRSISGSDHYPLSVTLILD